ncbi:MAG: hypothetical protein OHK0017_08700 [Patescibacteria group bacterium]
MIPNSTDLLKSPTPDKKEQEFELNYILENDSFMAQFKKWVELDRLSRVKFKPEFSMDFKQSLDKVLTKQTIADILKRSSQPETALKKIKFACRILILTPKAREIRDFIKNLPLTNPELNIADLFTILDLTRYLNQKINQILSDSEKLGDLSFEDFKIVYHLVLPEVRRLIQNYAIANYIDKFVFDLYSRDADAMFLAWMAKLEIEIKSGKQIPDVIFLWDKIYDNLSPNSQKLYLNFLKKSILQNQSSVGQVNLTSYALPRLIQSAGDDFPRYKSKIGMLILDTVFNSGASRETKGLLLRDFRNSIDGGYFSQTCYNRVFPAYDIMINAVKHEMFRPNGGLEIPAILKSRQEDWDLAKNLIQDAFNSSNPEEIDFEVEIPSIGKVMIYRQAWEASNHKLRQMDKNGDANVKEKIKSQEQQSDLELAYNNFQVLGLIEKGMGVVYSAFINNKVYLLTGCISLVPKDSKLIGEGRRDDLFRFGPGMVTGHVEMLAEEARQKLGLPQPQPRKKVELFDFSKYFPKDIINPQYLSQLVYLKADFDPVEACLIAITAPFLDKNLSVVEAKEMMSKLYQEYKDRLD